MNTAVAQTPDQADCQNQSSDALLAGLNAALALSMASVFTEPVLPYRSFEAPIPRHPPRRQVSFNARGRAQQALRRRFFAEVRLTGLLPKPPLSVSPLPELSKTPERLWVSRGIWLGFILVWTAGDGWGGVECWNDQQSK
jgi:hypothetical protein